MFLRGRNIGRDLLKCRLIGPKQVRENQQKGGCYFARSANSVSRVLACKPSLAEMTAVPKLTLA